MIYFSDKEIKPNPTWYSAPDGSKSINPIVSAGLKSIFKIVTQNLILDGFLGETIS